MTKITAAATMSHRRAGSLPSAKLDTVSSQGLYGGVEAQFDTGSRQRRLDHLPRSRTEFRTDGLGSIDQNDTQPLGRAVSAVRQKTITQLKR
jgi:hypothetical protein